MASIERIMASGRVRLPLLIGIAVAAGVGISAGAWSAGSGQAQAKAPAPARGVLLAAASNTDWCGDGYCDSGSENSSNCPQDCGYCGNGDCDNGENSYSCPQDCPHCGNGSCEGDLGEDSGNCEVDCPRPPPPPFCGDGECQREHESCNSCPRDCGGCSADGQCFPNLRECEAACRGVCERRIACGGASAHKCFE
jgi:hypothetical protein